MQFCRATEQVIVKKTKAKAAKPRPPPATVKTLDDLPKEDAGNGITKENKNPYQYLASYPNRPRWSSEQAVIALVTEELRASRYERYESRCQTTSRRYRRSPDCRRSCRTAMSGPNTRPIMRKIGLVPVAVACILAGIGAAPATPTNRVQFEASIEGPRIDPFQIMLNARDLPVETFHAPWVIEAGGV
jgi:hypothetical protein